MRRSVSRVPMGDDTLSVTVRLEGNPCAEDTVQAFVELVNMMKSITDLPDLIRHSSICPQAVKFFHNGRHWVAEATSVEPRVENE